MHIARIEVMGVHQYRSQSLSLSVCVCMKVRLLFKPLRVFITKKKRNFFCGYIMASRAWYSTLEECAIENENCDRRERDSSGYANSGHIDGEFPVLERDALGRSRVH